MENSDGFPFGQWSTNAAGNYVIPWHIGHEPQCRAGFSAHFSGVWKVSGDTLIELMMLLLFKHL